MTQASAKTINVLVAADFSDDLIERIREVSPRIQVERHAPTVPERAWETAEIIIAGGVFPPQQQLPRLRWMQLMSAGADRALKEPVVLNTDVIVTTASGIHATQISEYSLAMMLAFAYKIPHMLALQAKAEWQDNDPEKVKPELLFAPRELRGQTLGIVGYGSIGRELARIADSMGMNVLAIKRDVMHPQSEGEYSEPGTGDPEGEIPRRIYPPEAIVSMAKECDFLVLIMPGTQQTRHLINADVFKAMKKTAVLINVGRGSAVDEKELIVALSSGRIAGAGLDVFEEEPLPATSPLWGMSNVIISPHISGNSARYHEKVTDLFIENLQRYLENRPLLNVLKREHGY